VLDSELHWGLLVQALETLVPGSLLAGFRRSSQYSMLGYMRMIHGWLVPKSKLYQNGIRTSPRNMPIGLLF
jgi:hypothetical protein